MRTYLQILSQNERDEIHERSLRVLAETGVRIDTLKGRKLLKNAGAIVNDSTCIVRFPRELVEKSIALAPKKFSLGARRPEWDLEMNADDCVLLPDGEATSVLDRKTGEQRPCSFEDWMEATTLTDALDEIGLFWSMVNSGKSSETLPDLLAYWQSIFRNFSKHVQIMVSSEQAVPWFLETLQAVFGSQEEIRLRHPVSFLLCPQSPLIIDQQYTDAYLALLGWDIPVAIMPMPLMGGTAPGNMISTIIQGNCETLAMLCLVQVGAPKTPVIYAPVLATMNPRTGLYSGGAVENGLLGAAATEMARYYGLPVEASGGGSDHFAPGIQAAYERALNALIPVLSWPDILVGPGLLGSSMILSLEQLVIDVEIFKMSTYAHRGIQSGKGQWLDNVISRVGPGGNFLNQASTVAALRSGEWYIHELGVHEPQKIWHTNGRQTLLEEAREWVDEILASHKPLPLPDEVEKELAKINEKFRLAIDAA